jgi:hypothetical protein
MADPTDSGSSNPASDVGWGIVANFLTDLIKWVFPYVSPLVPPMIAWLRERDYWWATLILNTLVGWTCFYVLYYGFSTKAIYSLTWWQYALGVGTLALFVFLEWQKRRGQAGALDFNRGQQIPAAVQDTRPLKDVSYLQWSGYTFLVSDIWIDKEDSSRSPEIWSLYIDNSLLASDPLAWEATGVCVEITYYDKDWRCLCGPIQGCWLIEKGTGAQPYLSADPRIIGPQDRLALAVFIRIAKGHSPFGIGKESLPFFLWENAAFELEGHFLLRIVLKGDTIRQTLYCKVTGADEVVAEFDSVSPPPFLLNLNK